MTTHPIVAALIVAWATASCWRSAGPYEAGAPDADTDIDSDTDVDSDVDSDSDADSDSDVDTDSDSDTDGDTETETDTGSETTTDTGPDPSAWVTKAEGLGPIAVRGLAPLSTGGVALAGDSNGAVVFDWSEGWAFLCNVVGHSCGFAIVYDQAGTADWVVAVPSSGNSRMMSAAALPDDSVAVAGGFSDQWNETSLFGEIDLTSMGAMDAFVARIEDADSGFTGKWDWIRQIGGSGWDLATAVGLFGEDTLLVTGYFGYGEPAGAIVTLSMGEPDEATVTGWGSDCAFYAIYGFDGDLLEAGPLACGLSADPPFRTSSAGDGTLDAIGTFDGAATVRMLSSEPYQSYANYGVRSWFHVGFDAAHALDASWSCAGGDCWASSLALAPSGAAAVGGGFAGTNVLQDGDLALDLESEGAQDGLLALWDEAGDLAWLRSLRCGDLDAVRGVATGGDRVCFAGSVGNEVGLAGCDPVLDGDESWEAPTSTLGGSDLVFGCLTDAGATEWARTAGSTGDDTATAVAISELGWVFAAGTYAGDIVFDEGGPDETALDVISSMDGAQGIFIAKYEL